MRLGLRAQTAILLIAGMAPATVLIVAESRESLAHARAAARNDVRAMAGMVAEQHQRAVDTARGTLLAIARLGPLRSRDGAGCSRALAAVATATDLWTNLGAVLPDGQMYCSAFPTPGPVSLADRPFIQSAIRTGDVGTGTQVVSRVRGIGAFGFGYPVRDDAGAMVAVAFASLRTETLQRQLDRLQLSPHVAVEVIDRTGAVVTRRMTGKAPFGPEIAKLAKGGAELHEGPGADGVRRVFAFDRVEAVDGVAMWVIAAVPAEEVEGPVRALARRTLWGWAVAALAIVLGMGFVVEFLLLRRFRILSRTAARIAGGEAGARTGQRHGRDELGAALQAFDDMAEALEGLQRQHRLLLDSIGDGIVGVDQEATVVFANPAAARLLGIPAAELKGRPFASLVRHAGPTDDPCLVRRSLADGKVHLAADDSFTRSDGTVFPVESVTTPMVADGKIVGAVVALRDASERRRLEDQLRQAQKMEAVGQLAGGVAHDFNNLLTAIVTCGRMIQEALAPNHPVQPDVSEILSSADRAAQLTRQLLAFARRQRLAPRPIDLSQSVLGMERILRRVLGETISLSVKVPGEPVVILADPVQIEMVVLNLAVNARDAMPSGGELTVSVEVVPPATEPSAGPLAQLAVRDSGVGMDGDTQDRIFEPFFTTKPIGQGTGLGLATVYGIVKQSDGEIHVRSVEGEGTEFRVLFPLRTAAAAEPTRAVAAPAGGSERVMVVEDDDVLRALVCRALAGAGYRVLEASRPSGAVQRAGDEEIDLVVTDLVLPERSGWQLYREIAATRPGLKLLVMSGFAAEPAPGAAWLPPEIPFLAKPFAPHDLLAKVRQALEGPTPRV